MTRATATLSRTTGPNAAAIAIAATSAAGANIIWPVLSSRAAVSGLCLACIVFSLPEPVDPVVMVGGRVHERVAAELRLALRQAHLVGIRVITAPGNNPFDVMCRRVFQRRQPLPIAAFVDQLIGG